MIKNFSHIFHVSFNMYFTYYFIELNHMSRASDFTVSFKGLFSLSHIGV